MTSVTTGGKPRGAAGWLFQSSERELGRSQRIIGVRLATADAAVDARVVVRSKDSLAFLISDGRLLARPVARFPDQSTLLDQAQLVNSQRPVLAISGNDPSLSSQVAHASIDLLHAGEGIAELLLCK